MTQQRRQRVERLRATRDVRWLAPALMLAGGTSMYLGAAIAIDLFDAVSPAGVASVSYTHLTLPTSDLV